MYGKKSSAASEKSGDEPALNGASVHDLVGFLEPRMKGLVVCLSHSWGGLEQVVAQDTLELMRHGLDIEVLCLKDSPLHQNLDHQGFRKTIPIEWRPRNYFDLRLKKFLHAKIQSGTNLVHTHQTTLLGSIAPWLMMEPRVSLIASRHIMNDHNKRTPVHSVIYSRVDRLLVMSRALRRNIIQTHSISEKKVQIVPLGLDFTKFDPELVNPQRQRKEWGADDQTIVIGLVGRLDPAKGQAILIKAAIALRDRMPEETSVKFVIVGEETLGNRQSHMADLAKLVKDFGLEDRVIFTGFKENIPEIMHAFDIFVMPSRQETFGLVAIEAMAMECPIVISSGGSADEIVGNQDYGLTVRPMDAFDLQRTLRTLIENPELREQMGKRARDYVLRTYGKENRLHATLQIYEETLKKRLRLNRSDRPQESQKNS